MQNLIERFELRCERNLAELETRVNRMEHQLRELHARGGRLQPCGVCKGLGDVRVRAYVKGQPSVHYVPCGTCAGVGAVRVVA